jgi:hypothetical protein
MSRKFKITIYRLFIFAILSSNQNIQAKTLIKKDDHLSLNNKISDQVKFHIESIKDYQKSEQERWESIIWIGKNLGKKSIPLLCILTEHPHWLLRLGALKTLAAVGFKEGGDYYAKSLKDPSYLVRLQALENIRAFQLKKHAKYIWPVLTQAENFHQHTKEMKKEIFILAIRSLGELDYQPSIKPLMALIQLKKYEKYFDHFDYALGLLYKQDSPKGTLLAKRNHWKKIEGVYLAQSQSEDKSNYKKNKENLSLKQSGHQRKTK